MKPKVFIAGTREGLPKARKVKEYLSPVADCQLWNEGFFENNRGYFETLAEGSVLFDFAVLVATADDVQLKRESLETITRDNIVFEFGLYVGRLGRNRAFFIKEKGLDLPSDLYGIQLPEFSSSKKEGKNLEETCNDIAKQIEARWKTFELSFVPSTVLAVGYFENFVVRVCRELAQANKREAGGKNYEDFRLHIAVPDELPKDFQDQLIVYLNDRKLKDMVVETNTRKYNFYLDYSQKESAMLELYDIPTTLSALRQAVELAIPKSAIGETEKERLFKKKEMNNFCRTLTYLIQENASTRNKVVIEFINVG